MPNNKKEKKEIRIEAIKENIKKLVAIDKSLIPQYLDNVKQNAEQKQQEITEDNPYYKFL